jgi:hypothetical protein
MPKIPLPRSNPREGLQLSSMASMNSKTYIGQSLPRLEDPPLVRGRGRFAGDISFSASAAYAACALAGCARPRRRRRRSGGTGDPRSRCGEDLSRHRGCSADRLVEDATACPALSRSCPSRRSGWRFLDHRASLHPSNQAVLQKPRREGGLS